MDRWEMTEQEQKVYDFMLDEQVDIATVIAVVIKSNRLIGVGLVSLEDRIKDIIKPYYGRP